jgi:hypothetical protein
VEDVGGDGAAGDDRGAEQDGPPVVADGVEDRHRGFLGELLPQFLDPAVVGVSSSFSRRYRPTMPSGRASANGIRHPHESAQSRVLESRVGREQLRESTGEGPWVGRIDIECREKP